MSTSNQASIAKARVSSVADGGGTKITGTWSEYGVFAPRRTDVSSATTSIIGIASASGLSDASVVASNDQADWSQLTFGNSFSSDNPFTQNCEYGCFAPPPAMGELPAIQTYLSRYGLIDGSKIIAQSGTYNINNNITADSTGRPRIIIADNITIDDSVTQVDAWLIARNTLNTCQINGPRRNASLQTTDCTKTLRVNGPIIANTLLARRVGDAAVDKKAVGEIVNLRGDEYIWAHKVTHSTQSFKTTGVKELPPRY